LPIFPKKNAAFPLWVKMSSFRTCPNTNTVSKYISIIYINNESI